MAWGPRAVDGDWRRTHLDAQHEVRCAVLLVLRLLEVRPGTPEVGDVEDEVDADGDVREHRGDAERRADGAKQSCPPRAVSAVRDRLPPHVPGVHAQARRHRHQHCMHTHKRSLHSCGRSCVWPVKPWNGIVYGSGPCSSRIS